MQGAEHCDKIIFEGEDSVATKVKLADLAHNCDLSRFNHEPTEKDLARVRKYKKARAILEGSV